MQTSVNIKILEMRRKNKRQGGGGGGRVLLNYADSKRKETLWLSPASCVFTNTENEEM